MSLANLLVGQRASYKITVIKDIHLMKVYLSADQVQPQTICTKKGHVVSEYAYTVSNSLKEKGWRQVSECCLHDSIL
jgi:hypothetical protein